MGVSLKTSVQVSGMSCDHCVRAVRGVLMATKGVTEADVELQNGLATLHHDQPLDLEALAGALAEEGFKLATT